MIPTVCGRSLVGWAWLRPRGVLVQQPHAVLSELPLSLSFLTPFDFAMKDDYGLDDAIGSAKIDLERLDLTSDPQEVVRVVDHKKGASWFSRKAKIHLQVSYVEDDQ